MMTSAIDDTSLEIWERHTSAGFRALSCRRWREAADEWLRSHDDVRTAETWDARQAAAMNNMGVACLLEARWAAAERYFDMAREAWAQARARIPQLEIPVTGRSSVFHFRLATRHHEAFADSRRRRCAALCTAASAITDFNAGLTRHAAGRSSPSSEATSAIVHALVDAFGPRCPELKLIGESDNSVAGAADTTPADAAQTDAIYAEKALRAHELQARSMAAAFSADYRRLEMATNLTALLSPRLLGASTTNPSQLDGPGQ
jgi:hypothetical protein